MFQEFDIAHSVVSRLWKSFKTTECVADGTRDKWPAEDRYIVLSAKKEQAHHTSRWQISFLQPQESRSPEKLLPDV
ncbi:hypothetical protein TNCV_3686041 [Trichonephila clavipes]|nr:hypothetical protein TNCV_3686041 [Trichonephila clavipes]